MIGIFDSGIGGVTVLRELLKVLPNEDYLYYSDSKHSPYGNKNAEELIQHTDKIVSYLISHDCKLIVIACNTAGAVCKEALRKKYSIPIVVIEPAIKMTYDKGANNTLIMATKATIDGKNFNVLLEKYKKPNVFVCALPKLASLIEKQDSQKIENYLKVKLKNYKNIENVVLGCTHYPLIKKEITNVLGKVNFFDGSIGVSKQVKLILENKKMLGKGMGSINFFDSNNDERIKKIFFELVNNKEI